MQVIIEEVNNWSKLNSSGVEIKPLKSFNKDTVLQDLDFYRQWYVYGYNKIVFCKSTNIIHLYSISI